MNLYDLDTPAAIVDLDRLERNIARMAKLADAGGKMLRPHIKTHKTPEIARMQLSAGACGITVAKLGEAEVFAEAGFDDMFMANQVVGAPKLDRLITLLRRIRIAVGVDSFEVAKSLAAAGFAAGIQIPARIELDCGTGRAGVRSLDDAVKLAHLIDELPGLEFDGIYIYEGVVTKVSADERAAVAATSAAILRELASKLEMVGIPPPATSVGSTPAAPYMAGEHGVTEMRPGTYVFYDSMQTGWGASLDECALTVLTTVISRPDEITAILDAGTKSFSGDKALEGSRHGIVTDDPAIVFDWANEEHGHLDLRGTTLAPKVGQKLRVVPWHVCTCVNMHENLYAVRGEQVEAVWPVAARGKIT